ncbi:aminotransferase class I/II-fold pyridoxal phosphate-dependent enzyme [Streptosporangium sp. DT93]|uniref:aminotransferase class I/II-fold pyridoxal phosphate-dependent enzyme n=1 Tax=Streptosporangium sp. DT93 TaxID=3393428 RepID=UPI003CEA9ECD
MLTPRPIRAIILAAGLGTRLGRLKPLTPVAGVPILHRALAALASVGVRETIIVTGHRAEEITESAGETFAGMTLRFVLSPRYADTNNAYSLWLAREHLDTDLYLLDGDVVFAPDLLTRLADTPGEAVSAVFPWRRGLNGTVLDVADDGLVRRVHLSGADRPPLDLVHKTLNVHLLRARYLREEFVPLLDTLIADGGEQEFYEAVLARSTRFPIRAVDCADLANQEVDDATDLELADYRFGTPDQRRALLNGQHGGYWRHEAVDHDLLYNPYFPTDDLIDALTAEFRQALIHYPVGHDRLRDLLSSAIDVPAERLIVANGASELIKVLPRVLKDVVLVVPGFNEYESVFPNARKVALLPPELTVDAESLHRAAAGSDALILDSPNNPTSSAIPPEELLRLCKLLAKTGTRLIVDESFTDFCAVRYSLEGRLADHPNLVIVKSMSKAYGVAGLRLGYLATADTGLLARVAAEMPIWNVNGIAESFLRLLPRYQQAFALSLSLVRQSTDALYERLLAIAALDHVHRPDANFVLVRLAAPALASDVAAELFRRHGILVKDCSGKSLDSAERYVRISSRTDAENRRLVSALRDVLNRAERPPETVRADGLLIRRWRDTDIPARHAAITASRDHLRRWLPWATAPLDHEALRAFQRQSDEAWHSARAFSYGVFDETDGTLLGAVALHARIGTGALEVAYWVHAHHTRRGIITRAAAALTEAALLLDDVDRVEIHCDAANASSAAIPRRLGYRLDRTEHRAPRTPAESGHWMIWMRTSGDFSADIPP